MEQTLGKRIAENRKKLKLTQEQLAEKLGVTAQAVSKWENDISCPDISILPQLAQIFEISTDELLGYSAPKETVYTAHFVEEDDETDGLHIHSDNWNINLSSGKRNAIATAVFVILVGGLYLLNQLFQWDMGLWKILWTTGLFVYGISELFHKFSFLSLCSAIVGGFFLIENFLPEKLDITGGYVFAVLVVVFGISLLVDAFKKKSKPHISIKPSGAACNSGNTRHRYETGVDSFIYHAGFGSNRQTVKLPYLRSGEIHTSFGEYTVDLSAVESLAEHCALEANCSFGELTVLIPSRYQVVLDGSSAFAHVDICGQPNDSVEGIIYIDANASFGEICVEYI